MTDEETPLLGDAAPPSNLSKTQVAYARFSRSQKRTISALVSYSGLLPLFAGGSFIPSIPEIAHDLGSTPKVISLAVSISIFSAAVGSMTFATYSSFYGRRPMYMVGLPLLCIGSLGVGTSTRIPELLFWRFVQAFGASGGMSVGGGIIADIYSLTERGTAMGIFHAASLLGNALAPIVGGWVAHYTSWRYLQFGLCLSGALLWLLMLLYLPETSHPGITGWEKLIEAEHAEGKEDDGRFRWAWLNPLECLWYLRSPVILLTTYSTAATLITEYGLQVPMAHTIGTRYGITNPALIGACFIPMGAGNILGAPLAGWMSDRIVIKYREKRGGVWVPEDRLRGSRIGAATLVPLSVLGSGLVTQYGPDGMLGLALNLCCFFVNGVGVDTVLAPNSAYSVDIMREKSAQVMAAGAALRSSFLAIAVALVLPSMEKNGVLITDALGAAIAFTAFLSITICIRYGDKLRAAVDIGFTTIDEL
ncbi:unnamed protein product [Mycena citricolor]|uniref:Major facilitator superfamily (MFS) profile domain-containing protein n=1 Tax=Mycena citricolor TaxID=2018698 RepID=A0AAD2GQV1_9AGAR|nr:unnamed protein product [Mycena citricolor]